ncbi:MAG: pilus assembly protein [Burkholderiaceae bacterium]|nr:pilus assembly protein [Burkholderiaceae bacterium]MCP5217868.1 pilus assembly protein [Burkholderiaceae bacterium]
MIFWKNKFRALAVHLALSLGVAAMAAALVFWVWYRVPFRALSGGRELFWLVAGVDVVIGPLITFVVFNPRKPRREKVLDFSVIGVLQLAALGYGLHTIYEARPVHAVFEYNRFRVVHANDIPASLLPRTPAGIDALPLTGPTWLSLRPLVGGEVVDYTMQALDGVPVAARPELWQPYTAGRQAILAAARPVADLEGRFPKDAALIRAGVAQSGRAVANLKYLPIQGRKGVVWTVLLDATTAAPLAFVALDSF